MKKVQFLPCLLAAVLAFSKLVAQDGSSLSMSGNTMAASKAEDIPVNMYTGIPGISIPLYNYSHHSGLSMGITLDYFAGGIRVNETPSTAGLGWNLSTGGVIIRSIRGMPDDYPEKGFMYSPALPADYRQKAHAFYHDSLDAQQDVFQFNVNGRSGKFFIGKNKQIIAIPLSKMRISFAVDTVNNASITSFQVITEDGIKYVFKELEKGIFSLGDTLNGCNNYTYNFVWHLSQVIAPFATDTIKLAYKTITASTSTGLNHIAYLSNDQIDKVDSFRDSSISNHKKIASILFPNQKKITFVYDPRVKYDGIDIALNSIHISDSIFRYGYKFDWKDSGRTMLDGIRTYTATALNPGYKFIYRTPYFPNYSEASDSMSNKRDHWGYFNAANNGYNLDIPQLPFVEGIYSNGADRNPNNNALANSLSAIKNPAGGITYYEFENNDAARNFNIVPQYKSINCKSSTQTKTIFTTSHISNSSDVFTLTFSSFSQMGETYPIYGDGNLICTITDTGNANNIYATHTINLYNFYNTGKLSFTCSNLPTGYYAFRTSLSAGTVVTAKALFINLSWKNEVLVPTGKVVVGGIRIKRISHFDPVTGRTDTISTYKYQMPGGASSGFLGIIPSYHYPYQETEVVGIDNVVKNYMAINSEPVSNLSYVQGSPVGYKRVEIIKGSELNNIGKEVHDFSGLDMADAALAQQIFPYAPVTQRDWALGLPTRIYVYNNSGRLIQQTINEYNIVTTAYNDSNFLSLKLGRIARTFHGLQTNPGVTYTDDYEGAYYFPETGRADLKKSTQVVYHADQSMQSQFKEIQYDNNYNPVKMISSYDKTKNLKLERRMYYPYNYTIGGAIGIMRDSSIYTVVSTEDWITGDASPRMLAAAVTDFTQLSQGYIKPSSTYATQTNKPLLQTVIGAFNPSLLIRNTTYFKEQQRFVTYDVNGNCLELKNPVTGQSISEIMDYNNNLAVAKIVNARQSDVAYTSFESDGNGNWNIPAVLRNKQFAITGKNSYHLDSGNIQKSSLDPAITYIITYWKKQGASVSVSGASASEEIAQQNGWSLVTQTISNATSVTISGTGLIDELRLHPKDANMATTTYDPMIGVTSTCDANNIITYNLYDSLNRLIAILDKDKNIIKKYEFRDNITRRYLSGPIKIYASSFDTDPVSGQLINHCFAYWLYGDDIMSDQFIEPDRTHCPKAGNHDYPVQ